tara:strand:- start:88 stop:810 length:723 start_codon:yes stop_codon:yes gene_type:complete
MMKRFKERLKEMVLNPDSGSGKIFDNLIQFLIIISLVSFSIETLPSLTQPTLRILGFLEIIIVIIFSFEYVLKILFIRKPFKNYIFSFTGLIDLLAVLPFYLQSGLDLRSIRIFRLLRLLRLFKLFRDGSAITTFKLAFRKVKAELTIFIIATFFILYIASVGIYYFENQAQPENFGSIFHSMWWAVATLTSVGYGDVYPVTVGGKAFTSIIVLIGIGIVAVPTGLLASAITRTIISSKE